jgi:hypothetical protein
MLASAGAAQAADRYGPGPSDSEASRQAYGEPAPSNRLLNWGQKAPQPARQQADVRGQARPQAVSEWARRADAQRADRMSTPVQGQVIPQSSYTLAAAGPAPSSLPTSLYSPAPAGSPYRAAPRPKGAAIEVNPDALPNQPTIAQQMASEEAASMLEAKAARANALNKTNANSALVQSQDAVR